MANELTFNGQAVTDTAPAPSLSEQIAWLGKELLEASIDDYVTKLDKVPAICGTPDQQETLLSLIAEGSPFIKLAEAERKKITSVLDAQKKDWMNLEKKLITPVLKAQERLRSVVDQYNREQVRIRQQQQAALQAERDREIQQKGASDWLAPELPVVHMPRGVQMRWTFEVTMPKVVPRQFLTIDEKAIKEAIFRGVREIDGIRIYQEPVTTTRV